MGDKQQAEEGRKTKRWIRYAVAVALGFLMAALVLVSRGTFAKTDPQMLAQDLSDACFVPAVILCGVGLLVFVASDGFFDLMGFGVKKMLSLFQRDDGKLSGSFYDYKLMRQAKRSGGYGFLLMTGGFFLLLATGFLLMYQFAV